MFVCYLVILLRFIYRVVQKEKINKNDTVKSSREINVFFPFLGECSYIFRRV